MAIGSPTRLQLSLAQVGPCKHFRSLIKLYTFIFQALRLKRFDESTLGSRLVSQAGTPPKSVKGIGNKGRLQLKLMKW